MGSSASKASRAAGAATRQYPKQPSPASTSNATPRPQPAQTHQLGPTVRPQPQASASRSEAINLDASDPDFARQLRSLGPVQPNPTLSPSSAFTPGNAARPTAPDPRRNPAIMILDARSKLQDQADEEFMAAGRRGHAGRQFLDATTIRQVLMLRDHQRMPTSEIETELRLKSGVVDRLGPRNTVGLVHEVGRERREIDMV